MGDTRNLISILFITQYFPPETGAGPTRINELTKRWVDRGHDVTVVTSMPDYPEGEIYDGYENNLVRTEWVDGVRVIYLLTIPASNNGFLRRGLKFVWFMLAATIAGLWLDRHDIVVSTAPQPLTGPAGWIIARAKGSRFIYEVRDLWPESITSLSDISGWIVEPLRWMIEFTYRHADQLVAVSPGFEPTFVEAGANSEDVLVHYNGVDPAYFEHDSDWSLDEETVAELQQEFVVAYVGTLGRAHGLSVALDAAEQLDDVTFLFVGTGAEEEMLRREVKRRKIENVRFEGRHPKEHVPDFLAVSDLALVHLKNKDLFRTAIPSKTFEAMAAGLPVLMGVRGTATNIVERSDTGLPFQPMDPTDLAAVIRELRDDNERRATMGTNGETFVDAEFSWDQIAESYARDLEALVDS
jgi:Glycosyltransferase